MFNLGSTIFSGNAAINTTTDYDSVIYNYASMFGVDDNLIRAFIQAESSWYELAYNLDKKKDGTPLVAKNGVKSESIGLMQLTVNTANWIMYADKPVIKLQQLYNVDLNIHCGVKVIANKLSRYHGDVRKAISAYNGGTAYYTLYGNFTNQQYVDKVFGFYQQYIGYAISFKGAYSQQIVSVDPNTGDTVTSNVVTPPDLNTVDTTIADAATADVPDMSSDLANDTADTASVDDPTSISIPFDPITMGLFVLGGVVLVSGGYLSSRH